MRARDLPLAEELARREALRMFLRERLGPREFKVNSHPDRWWDPPANRHSQGGNLSFADGHVERWKWEAPKVFRQMGRRLSPGDR